MTEDGAPQGFHVADRDRLLECVHCGLCLDACPTYVETGLEADSPRGRIHLIRALEEGSLSIDDAVVRHLDLCLGCRACETACPSGVRYGRIIEQARAHVEAAHRRPWWDAARRRIIAGVFPRPERLRVMLGPVRWLQRLGLWPLVVALVPPARLVPPLEPGGDPVGVHPSRGTERARVGLLLGCVAREMAAATNRATVNVLTRNGVTVVVPGEQGCCGALLLHGGDPAGARALARRNVDAFADDLDAVIVNAAGCGAAMKEYGELLAGDPRFADRARAFASRVRDATEFLAALPIAPASCRSPRLLTYHDACHLAHGQGIREQPRALLRAIPGVELVELEEADTCCGSAGSYNLTQAAMARRLRERKIDRVVASGATCVAVANPGCAMQIRAGLETRGVAIRVAHPLELLEEAYAVEDG